MATPIVTTSERNVTLPMVDNTPQIEDTSTPASQNFLRVIVDPQDGAEVDIIAVHGLNPTNDPLHAESTWTSGDKLWLRDFLPEEMPTARIMLFGYNANTTFQSSTAGVLEQANNLLNRLRTRRRKDKAENRPIIFIAHSLGGIIVKRALITAGQVERYSKIRRATYGMVFFATPHRGGEFVKLGNIAVKIVQAVFPSPKNSFLEALEKDSMFADTIVQDFRNMGEDFKVLSFYETRPLGPFGIIVDNKSATLGLSSNRENTIALDLDHRSICKFKTKNDDYEQVQDNISEMVEEAIEYSRQSQHLFRSDSNVSSIRTDSYYSIKSEPLVDTASMMESINQSTMSLALSDPDPSDPVDEKRRSTSTVTTEHTIDPNRQEKQLQQQSPRLFSSIAMNTSDSDGLKFRAAAAEGKKDIVKLMLEQGSPIDNSGVWDGFSALADAALHGQEAVVKLLLDEGANPAFRCISMTKKYGSKENTPLSLAAAKGHIGTMKLLLDFHTYTTHDLDGAYRAAKARNRVDAMKMIQKYGGGLY